MRRNRELTQARLKLLLSYDPATGAFTRLVKTSWNAMVGGSCGCVGSNGYRYIMVDGRKYLASRLAFLYMTGAFPAEFVDHISGDTRDDSWRNLRPVSHAENLRNCQLSKNNTSGHVGVYWILRRGKWAVDIRVAGKTKRVGYFDEFEVAAAARRRASEANGYHANHGRKRSRMRELDRSKGE